MNAIPSRWWDRVRTAALWAAAGAQSLACLVPLALIFDLAGYMPPHLRLALLLLLLAVPALAARGGAACRAWAGLAGVATLQAVAPVPAAAEPLIWMGLHGWLWTRCGAAPAALARGSLAFAALHLFLFVSPLGHDTLESLARLGCRVSGWVLGTAPNLGPTYQNLGSLLLFACFSVAAWERAAVTKWRTASFLGVALLANALLAAILLDKVNLNPDLAWKLQYREPLTFAALAGRLRNITVLVYPLALFLAHALAYLVLHHDVRGRGAGQPPAAEPWRRGPAMRLAAAAVLAALATLPPCRWSAARPGRLVCLEKGVVSYSRPDYERFGQGASGMYGMLPLYARCFGFRAEVVKEVPAALERDDILLVTNLDEPLAPATHERIWDFVRAGGKLWVLGDHTFIKNGRNHINDLLAPTHLSLNNNSAQFHPQGWFHSYRLNGGTPFAGLEDDAENRLGVLVGASVALSAPARPFLVGRFGFSDWGLEAPDKERGYLGDFKYQSTERLGDLVLVAGEPVGRGRVLLFGDTTSFFNANLGRSYELLRACLTWLTAPPGANSVCSRLAGGLAAIAALALALLAVRASSLQAALVASAALAVTVAVTARAGWLPLDQAVARPRLAVVDYSTQPYASKHSSTGQGLYGLSLNLLRYGKLPVTQNHWDRELLQSANLVFLPAPRRALRASERADLSALMERGGTVVVACGYPHYAHARALLAPLGLRVLDTPLGRFFDREAFGEPVRFFSAWPIESHLAQAQVLAKYDDWPLIVSVPVGAGRLILIPDSEFFHNQNLESLETYSPLNIQFMRALLDYAGGPPPP